jgi:hypothetical protein
LALLLRRQYEFPQCGINKGIFFRELFFLSPQGKLVLDVLLYLDHVVVFNPVYIVPLCLTFPNKQTNKQTSENSQYSSVLL